MTEASTNAMTQRDRAADTVFVRARVRTMDPRRPSATALAVRDGRMLSVGDDADVAETIGPATVVIDAEGRTLLPGFQDAHVHPPEAGLERMRCDLNDVEPSAYLERIRAYAQANLSEEWILGGGWAMAAFPRGLPRREDLDTVVADRPVFLTNRDGHGAWVNTRALAVTGIGSETPDPRDGRIERDLDGAPTGALHEGAMTLVTRLLPEVDRTQWERAILEAQRHLHSLGITAWQDAIVTPETLAAYRSLAARGALTARVVTALWWDRHRGAEQIEGLVEQRNPESVGRLRSGTVKIMQDGVAETFTAGMLEPYLDHEGRPTSERGLSHVDPEALKAHVTALDRAGFQVHVHAIGDRAVREALDAFEAARLANGPNDHRHHIAHLQVMNPDDIPRFAQLDVTANAQALWACLDDQMRDLTLDIIGPERAANQYPFGRLVRSGARLAMGSDWSVSTADPFPQLEVAVERVAPEDRGSDVFLPDERLDLDTAVHAFTSGSAYVNHLDETGSIEPGKLADLVLVDRDLFDRGAGPIGDAGAALTMVEGETVFAAGGFA
jgi:predicted amidohydrolase YtcJ